MEVALGFFEDDNAIPDDPNQPPTDGIAYLKRVQQETARCPQIVISEQHVRELDISDHEVIGEEIVPIIDAPSQERQTKMAADFAHLRQTFIRYKKTNRTKSLRKYPKTHEINEWYDFFYGSKKLDEENHEKDLNSGHAPLLSILLEFSQPLAGKLLKYHLHWLNRYGFSYKLGQWLFCILLCFDRPTPSEIVSALRDVSRKLFQLRRDMITENQSNESIPHIDILLVLVSKYFGQVDLSL